MSDLLYSTHEAEKSEYCSDRAESSLVLQPDPPAFPLPTVPEKPWETSDLPHETCPAESWEELGEKNEEIHTVIGRIWTVLSYLRFLTCCLR